MIVTVSAYKGGVGKTTSAIHVAGVLAERTRTLLVDRVRHPAAFRWYQKGRGWKFEAISSAISGDAAVGDRIREYRANGSIVVDTPAAPRPEELVALGARSDVVLVPTTPDALAVEALVDTVRDLKQEGVVFRVVLTQVPPFPSREGAKTRTSFSKAKLPVLKAEIPRAAAFQHAAKKGVLVRDLGDRRSAALWAAYQAVVGDL